jgi:hypothetical protein
MARFETCYNVHGHPIRVSTGSPLVAAAAAEVLVGQVDDLPTTDRPSLSIRLDSVSSPAEAPLALPAAAELVRRPQTAAGAICFSLHRDQRRWLFDFGDNGLLSLDPDRPSVEGWLANPERMPPDWAASFVLLAAIELLRTQGLYAVHAAAVEKDGAGILVVAPSGAGKTTACLSLVRAGYRYLSDDHPLFNGRLLLPFPGRLAVTERTRSWFPELARNGLRQDTLKRSFRIEDVFPTASGRPCPPRLLLFLRLADWHESFAEPLSPARALEELLPQTLLLLDPALAARQFHTMAELVRAIPAYRLHFG